MKIFIDWKTIDTYEHFFDAFLPQVKAPDWHGKNLDALSDSLITGGINQVEPPFCVIYTNIENMSVTAKNVYDAVGLIFDEANEIGKKIRVFEE
ncbi:barstar family protein [Alteromonas stellipolaris]|uniref:barstar family protein n=1 Tax=Alteromonas stellipolaris TaxID=233316 RepID=UPI0027338DC7|nr:barstar family protein [Alteromonas stellipolaris]MDP2596565.1 barstar family protein [Alteromonas stellipolaris]